MHRLARSIEVCQQYHLLRAGALAEVKTLRLPAQVEHYAVRLRSVRTSIRQDITLGYEGHIGTASTGVARRTANKQRYSVSMDGESSRATATFIA